MKNNLQKIIRKVFVQPIFAIQLVKSEVFSSFLHNDIIASLLLVFGLVPGQRCQGNRKVNFLHPFLSFESSLTPVNQER